MMNRFYTLTAVAAITLGTASCASRPAPGQMYYTMANNAEKIVEAPIVEVYTAARNLINTLGVVSYERASNAEEAICKFDYQNLTYTITMEYKPGNNTLVNVSAVSNVVFKNKARASEMLLELERVLRSH